MKTLKAKLVKAGLFEIAASVENIPVSMHSLFNRLSQKFTKRQDYQINRG